MSSTTKNIKDVIREEYVKCAKDPIYFMKKYVKIQHPIRGTLPFLTYPFQDETLSDLIEYDQNIILKSRQMGITTLVAGYSLWLMMFHENKEIICLSITQETSKAIVTKVRFANDNLPSWLKLRESEDNRLSLKLSNGSKIVAISSASTAGRSGAASLLIIDEAAFIDNIDEIWLSSQYTLATGGKAVVLSTPNGVGNWFHKMWTESESGLNNMNRISIPWQLHPERNQKWRDDQTKLSGERGAAQECDCEFSTSGNTVIEIPILQWYEKTHTTEPTEKRGFDKGLWIYKYPEAGNGYMISADVGRGDAADFSAFQVLDIKSMEQVAEYKGKIPTKDYARVCMTVATEYNMALLVIENANIGWAVIQEVLDKNYPNLFYSSADLQYVDVDDQMTNKLNAEDRKMKPGFTTSSKSRPLLISKLESYLRNKEVVLHSKRLIEELNVFIWKSTGTASARAEAMSGYNDDLVMSLAIGLWIRDVALRLRNDADGVTKTILDKIGSTSSQQIKNNTRALYKTNMFGVQPNPWQMNVGGQCSSQKLIDLTWLL
jgi:hypothetical protein